MTRFEEIHYYLYNRSEFFMLTVWQKRLLLRYVRMYSRDGTPIGRVLAHACMCYNKRYLNRENKFTSEFISWLYYY
jgi:hypothetical protein